ncbi:MAG TPA: heparinase II/III family protein, partial [Candidatus Hydrogenedentes bacterium]|nr:heparinase II/III family protein [Candidatus Hydrogenedentota bacterium]
AIVAGVRILGAAYLLTGDPRYAHKAGVLLDRVADLYPEFDFKTQALVYEVPGVAGYVSTWHDACEETRELAMAYDMVCDALREDTALAAFLSEKAAKYGLANPKTTPAEVLRNIEDRILRDALAARPKITTNYPRTEIAVALILRILDPTGNRAAFGEVVDAMLTKATAVDGVTGEKGLAGYSSFTIAALAMFLAEMDKADPDFLAAVYERHPRIRETFRFHIDTLCLDRYYPMSGDTGAFAIACPEYKGMNFLKPGFTGVSFSAWTFVPPSCFSLLWRLYELTGDIDFVRIAYRGNGNTFEGMPWDLFAGTPDVITAKIRAVLDEHGPELRLLSVNKQQWCLAILRSGEGAHARAVWLDYDSGGGHGHHDGMNLGLFAKGLDLMPEFGYPPVQYGGWGSPRARWYTMTAAHNTVVVYGRNTSKGTGQTTLWADGRLFHAIRAAAPALNEGNRYERTVILVDVSPEQFYVAEVFRVAGGAQHTKFMHSHFGGVETAGLELSPAPDFGHETFMRDFRMDASATPGWRAEWRIEDRLGYLPEGAEVRLRYTDLTANTAAGVAEAWVVAGSFDTNAETWIPRIVVQRARADGQPLDSTFVGVTEPYDTAPAIARIERISLDDATGLAASDADVALLITLSDGRKDILVIRDPEVPVPDAAASAAASEAGNAPNAAQRGPSISSIASIPSIGLHTDAEAALVRLDAAGTLEYAALCGASVLEIGESRHEWPDRESFRELP